MSADAAFDRYLTEAEEKQLLGFVGQFAADPYAVRDHAWMRLLRQTGIRVESASLLLVSDAREARATKHLVIRPETAKAGNGYTVFCNTSALRALHDLLKVRRELGWREIPDEPLIVSRKHRGLSVRSFQARMQFWCREAGLPINASPHWWRHTLAKRLIARSEAADPLGIVQSALGHRNRNSTAIYARPDREQVRQALEAAR